MAQTIADLYGIMNAGDLQFKNLATGENDLYIGYANKVSVELTADTVYAYAKGAKAVSFDKPTEGTMTISVDLMSFDLMGFILGSSLKSQVTNFYKRETFTVAEADQEVTLSAKPTDIVGSSVAVYALGKDLNSQGSKISTASYLNGKVTLTGCKEGDRVVIYYMTQATANVFKVSANKAINGFHQLNMVTTGKSWADGGEVPMELEFKKVSPQTNVTFGFDAKDVTSFDIKLDLLADSNNDIFEIKDIKSGETQGA